MATPGLGVTFVVLLQLLLLRKVYSDADLSRSYKFVDSISLCYGQGQQTFDLGTGDFTSKGAIVALSAAWRAEDGPSDTCTPLGQSALYQLTPHFGVRKLKGSVVAAPNSRNAAYKEVYAAVSGDSDIEEITACCAWDGYVTRLTVRASDGSAITVGGGPCTSQATVTAPKNGYLATLKGLLGPDYLASLAVVWAVPSDDGWTPEPRLPESQYQFQASPKFCTAPVDSSIDDGTKYFINFGPILGFEARWQEPAAGLAGGAAPAINSLSTFYGGFPSPPGKKVDSLLYPASFGGGMIEVTSAKGLQGGDVVQSVQVCCNQAGYVSRIKVVGRDATYVLGTASCPVDAGTTSIPNSKAALASIRIGISTGAQGKRRSLLAALDGALSNVQFVWAVPRLGLGLIPPPPPPPYAGVQGVDKAPVEPASFTNIQDDINIITKNVDVKKVKYKNPQSAIALLRNAFPILQTAKAQVTTAASRWGRGRIFVTGGEGDVLDCCTAAVPTDNDKLLLQGTEFLSWYGTKTGGLATIRVSDRRYDPFAMWLVKQRPDLYEGPAPGKNSTVVHLETFRNLTMRGERPPMDIYIVDPYDGWFKDPILQGYLRDYVDYGRGLFMVGPDLTSQYLEQQYAAGLLDPSFITTKLAPSGSSSGSSGDGAAAGKRANKAKHSPSGGVTVIEPDPSPSPSPAAGKAKRAPAGGSGGDATVIQPSPAAAKAKRKPSPDVVVVAVAPSPSPAAVAAVRRSKSRGTRSAELDADDPLHDFEGTAARPQGLQGRMLGEGGSGSLLSDDDECALWAAAGEGHVTACRERQLPPLRRGVMRRLAQAAASSVFADYPINQLSGFTGVVYTQDIVQPDSPLVAASADPLSNAEVAAQAYYAYLKGQQPMDANTLNVVTSVLTRAKLAVPRGSSGSTTFYSLLDQIHAAGGTVPDTLPGSTAVGAVAAPPPPRQRGGGGGGDAVAGVGAPAPTPGGGGAAVVGAQYAYVGCYRDNAAARGLTTQLLQVDRGISIQKCADKAAAAGVTYFGLQGFNCFGGNDMSTFDSAGYGKAASDDMCSAPCFGARATDKCGLVTAADTLSSVYKVVG